MGFQPGVSGNPGGRPARAANIPQEIRDLARKLFDARYWRRTRRLLLRGELNPKIEVTLLAYAFGNADKVDHGATGVTVNVGFITTARQLETVALTLPAEPSDPQILAEPQILASPEASTVPRDVP